MEYNQLVAARLSEVRNLLGLKAEAVAELTGKSKTTISNIENGLKIIDVADLDTFAKAYQMPVSYLLPNGGASPTWINQAETNHANQVFTQINQSDPSLKKLLEKLISKL